MALRDDFEGWLSFDDGMRQERTQFAAELASFLPAGTPTAPIGQMKWRDKDSALRTFDDYNSLEETARQSEEGKRLAAELKAYIGMEAAQDSKWLYPQEGRADRNDPAVARRMGFLESLIVPFGVGMADFGGKMLQGADPFIPGDGAVQEFMTTAGKWMENAPTAQAQANSAYMQSMPMWIADPDKPWTEEIKDLPDVINGWAAKASANTALVVLSALGGAAAGAVAGNLTGVGLATPEEPLTAAAGGLTGAAVSAFASKWVGGTVPMIAIEAASFLEMAEGYGIPRDMAEKYARIYGTGSGVIEGIQQLGRIKSLKNKGLAEPIIKAQDKILKRVFMAAGDMAWEGGEEVTQGVLMNQMLKRAVAEMKEKDPDWEPSKEIEDYSKDEAKRDFAMGATLGGIYKMSGKAIDMVRGNTDSDTQRATYDALRTAKGANIVRTADLQTMGKNVGEVLLDPKQNEKRALQRDKYKRGSIFNESQEVEKDGTGLFEFMRDEYSKLKEAAETQEELEAADLELGRWMANRFGIIEADDWNDYQSLSAAIKRGDLRKMSDPASRHAIWTMTPEYSKRENSVKLATHYGLAQQMNDPSDLIEQSDNLRDDQIDNDDYMVTWLSQKKDRTPEESMAMVSLIRAARDAGLFKKIAKAPLSMSSVTQERLAELGYGTLFDATASTTTVDVNGKETRTFDVVPKAMVHKDALGRKRLVLTSNADFGNLTEDVLELITREDMLDTNPTPATENLKALAQKWVSGMETQLKAQVGRKNLVTPDSILASGKKDKARGVFGKATPDIVSSIRKKMDNLFSALAIYQRGKDPDRLVSENAQKSLNTVRELLADDMTYQDASVAAKAIQDATLSMGNSSPDLAFATLSSMNSTELLSKSLSYFLDSDKKAKDSVFSYLEIPPELIAAVEEVAGPEVSAILKHGNTEAAPANELALKVDLSVDTPEGTKPSTGVSEPSKATPVESEETGKAEEKAPVEVNGSPVDGSPAPTDADAESAQAIEDGQVEVAFEEEIVSFSMDVANMSPKEKAFAFAQKRKAAQGDRDKEERIANKKKSDSMDQQVRKRLDHVMDQLTNYGQLNDSAYLRALELVDQLKGDGLTTLQILDFFERKGEHHPDMSSTLGIAQPEMNDDVAEFLDRVDIQAMIEAYEADPEAARESLMSGDGSMLLDSSTLADAIGITDETIKGKWDELDADTRIAVLEAFGQMAGQLAAEEKKAVAESFVGIVEKIKNGTLVEDEKALEAFSKVVDIEAIKGDKPQIKLLDGVAIGLRDDEIIPVFQSLPAEARRDIFAKILDKNLGYDAVMEDGVSASRASGDVLGEPRAMFSVEEINAEGLSPEKEKSIAEFMDYSKGERTRRYLEDRLEAQKEEGFVAPDPEAEPIDTWLKRVIAYDFRDNNGIAALLKEVLKTEVVGINRQGQAGAKKEMLISGNPYRISEGKVKSQIERLVIQGTDKVAINPADLSRAAAENSDAIIVFFSTKQFDKSANQTAMALAQLARTGMMPPVAYGTKGLGVNDWDMLGANATQETETFRSVLPLDLDTLTDQDIIPAIRAFIKENSAREIAIFGNLNTSNIKNSPTGVRLKNIFTKAFTETGMIDRNYRETVNPRSYDGAGYVAFREMLVATIGRGSAARLIDTVHGNVTEGIKAAETGRENAEFHLYDVDGIAAYLWTLSDKRIEQKIQYYLKKSDALEDSPRYKTTHTDMNPSSPEVTAAKAEAMKTKGTSALAGDVTYEAHERVGNKLLESLDNKDFLLESIGKISYQSFSDEIAARYLPKLDEIHISPKLLRQKFNNKAWTVPKRKGVPAFPAGAFQNYGEWFAFATFHEIGHRAWHKLGLTEKELGTPESKSAMEATLNGWAYGKLAKVREAKADLGENFGNNWLTKAILSTDIRSYAQKGEVAPLITKPSQDTQDTLLRVVLPSQKGTFGTENQPSFSLEVASVSPDGEVSIGFKGNVSSKAAKLFGNGSWNLEKALQESGFGKGAIKYISSVADQSDKDLKSIVDTARASMPTMKITDRGKDRAGEASYADLSVNKGEGQYKELMITLPFEVPGQHGSFNNPNLAGWFRVREYREGQAGAGDLVPDEAYLEEQFANLGTEEEVEEFIKNNPIRLPQSPIHRGTSFVEIQEIQSELFQKNKSGFSDIETEPYFLEDENYFEPPHPMFDDNQAAFLNTMLEKQTWVSVFFDAAMGYAEANDMSSVRFPTGDTAAKVEGHEVLANRLEGLQNRRKFLVEMDITPAATQARLETMELEDEIFNDMPTARWTELERQEAIDEIDTQINDLKTQGIDKLSPIEAFYEKRIGKLARKMDSVDVTDDNGNTWREVILPNKTASTDTHQGTSFSMTKIEDTYDSWNELPQLKGGLELRKRLMDADREKRAQVNIVLRKLQIMRDDMKANGIDPHVGMTLATIKREGIEEDSYDKLGIDKAMQKKLKAMKHDPTNTNKITDQTKALLDDMFDTFNKLSKEMVGDEFIKFYRDNYIPHLYVAKNKAAEGKRSTTSKSSQHRVFETFVEAEKAGYTPLSLEADKLIARYAEMNYSIIAHKTLLKVAPLIMGADGDPMVIPRYATDPSERLPQASQVEGTLMNKFSRNRTDYQKIPSPFLGVQEYWVHPDAVNTMKWVLQSGVHGRMATIFNGVMRVNNWAKFSALGLSLFHHFSLMESYIAANGGKAATGFVFDAATGFGRVWMRKTRWQEYLDATKSPDSPEARLADEFIRAGLSVNTAPTYDKGQIEVDLDHMIANAKNSKSKIKAKVIGRAAKMINAYREFNDNHLWNSMLPGMKLFTAARLLDKYEGIAQEQGQAIDRKHVMEQIASYVNYAYGGIEFEKYMAMTPNVKKFLTLAVFAPDWTLSNMNIADIANLGGGKGPIMQQEMRNHYWPWMAFVITALPAAAQALIYAGFGDDDEGDKAFMFQNEVGNKFGIDVTPILRAINPDKNTNPLKMDLGLAGRERYYITFGKQAREIGGLFENPIKMFYGKSSMVVRMAFEQITNTSGDWDMPWRGENFWESMPQRGLALGSKFAPMSIMSYLGQKRPSTLFAPSRKGMTRYKAEQLVTGVLDAYANPTTWKAITRGGATENFVEDLDSLVVDVADALRLNVGETGTPADRIVATSAGKVKTEYYAKFFDALNDGDEKAMEKWAASAIRLGAVVDTFNRSMDGKFDRNEGVEYTYEKRRMVETAVRKAETRLGRPVSSTSRSRKLLREMMKQTSGGSKHVESYLRSNEFGNSYWD